jgi:hypothetical protein
MNLGALGFTPELKSNAAPTGTTVQANRAA